MGQWYPHFSKSMGVFFLSDSNPVNIASRTSGVAIRDFILTAYTKIFNTLNYFSYNTLEDRNTLLRGVAYDFMVISL